MSRLRRTAYRLGDALYGWGVLRKMARLTEMERWPAKELEAFQLERLRQLLRHAYDNVPFYRELWGAAGVGPNEVNSLADLAALPKATKRQMLDAGQAVLDRTRSKGSMIAGASSGSTGEPFRFYKDRQAHAWGVASVMHGWTWAGWRLGEPWLRLQFRGSLRGRARLEDAVLNCLYMPMDRFDEAFVRRFVDRALRHRPVMVRGYAGATYVFAKFLLDAGERRLRPRVVVTTGDTLYPHYRQAIEAAFACPVFDTYGGEGIIVANQCEHGGYHVLPPVLVQIESEGPPMPEGQPGRLILTNLMNYAMPMIRYDIADLGIAGEGPCPCGRTWPFLRRVVGRDVDIVVTHTGRRLVCHHFNNVLRKLPGVEQFQILQSQPHGVTVRIVPNDRYDRRADEPAIRERIAALGGEGFGVDVQYVDDIPVPPTGKRRYIISTVPGAPGNHPAGAGGERP